MKKYLSLFAFIPVFVFGLSFSFISYATWVCPSNPTAPTDQVGCNSYCGDTINGPVSCYEVADNSGSQGGSTRGSFPGGASGGRNPFADGAPYPHGVTPPPGGPINDVSSFLYILTRAIEFAQVIFWILAVGFGLYSAYLYLFSGGNTEKVSQAQKMLIYTAVACLLAIVAYGLPGIVEGFVFGY